MFRVLITTKDVSKQNMNCCGLHYFMSVPRVELCNAKVGGRGVDPVALGSVIGKRDRWSCLMVINKNKIR